MESLYPPLSPPQEDPEAIGLKKYGIDDAIFIPELKMTLWFTKDYIVSCIV